MTKIVEMYGKPTEQSYCGGLATRYPPDRVGCERRLGHWYGAAVEPRKENPSLAERAVKLAVAPEPAQTSAAPGTGRDGRILPRWPGIAGGFHSEEAVFVRYTPQECL